MNLEDLATEFANATMRAAAKYLTDRGLKDSIDTAKLVAELRQRVKEGFLGACADAKEAGDTLGEPWMVTSLGASAAKIGIEAVDAVAGAPR